MNALMTILALSFVTANASAVLPIAKCAPNAHKVMKAIQATYKNPAELEKETPYKEGHHYIYPYIFTYAIPYDDEGRGQMESQRVLIQTNNWDCSVEAVSMAHPG